MFGCFKKRQFFASCAGNAYAFRTVGDVNPNRRGSVMVIPLNEPVLIMSIKFHTAIGSLVYNNRFVVLYYFWNLDSFYRNLRVVRLILRMCTLFISITMSRVLLTELKNSCHNMTFSVVFYLLLFVLLEKVMYRE
jgi:hypothetical protein